MPQSIMLGQAGLFYGLVGASTLPSCLDSGEYMTGTSSLFGVLFGAPVGAVFGLLAGATFKSSPPVVLTPLLTSAWPETSSSYFVEGLDACPFSALGIFLA